MVDEHINSLANIANRRSVPAPVSKSYASLFSSAHSAERRRKSPEGALSD